MYICKFCNSQFEKSQQLARHLQCCKENPANTKVECQFCHQLFVPNRLNLHQKKCTLESPKKTRYTGRGFNWSKGLTKETDVSIKKQSDQLKIFFSKHDGTFQNKHHSGATKQKISDKLLNYNHADNQRNLHSKGGWFNGLYFMSTWELAYYIYMTDKDIDVSKCKDRFKYTYNNKEHFYTPDFIVNDEYVEIKGREVGRDLIKYEAVRTTGAKLVVLYEKDLASMIKYTKTKYNVKSLTTLYCRVA